MRKILVILCALTLVLGVLASSAFAAPAPKVDVCHYDADTGLYHKINISENAFDAHVAHGDTSPGDPGSSHVVNGQFVGQSSYPGLTTTIDLWQNYVFDEDCGLLPGSYFGTGSYSYTPYSWIFSLTVTDACPDGTAGTVTVRGMAVGNFGALTGYAALSLKYEAGMQSRAWGIYSTSAEVDNFYAQQCGANPGWPAKEGAGFLTFYP